MTLDDRDFLRGFVRAARHIEDLKRRYADAPAFLTNVPEQIAMAYAIRPGQMTETRGEALGYAVAFGW